MNRGRRTGTQQSPDREHLAAAASALREVAAATTMISEGQPLRVTLCQVEHPLRYPFELFVFNLVAIDENGEFYDPVGAGDELLFAVVSNLSVELQREAAIGTLYDLVLRQKPVAEVRARVRDVHDLPRLAMQADAASAEAAADLLRFGWREATSLLQLRAKEAGFRLEVSFRPDPFPARGMLVRRLPALRQLYNEDPAARELVDRSVSAFARAQSQIRGGPEAVRQNLEQSFELASPRQFIDQALRDADVCGNGFLEMGTRAGIPSFRCIRPEVVSATADGRLTEHTPEGDRLLGSKVLHHRGLTQVHSPYGISILEPLLFALNERKVAANTRAFAEAALASSELSPQFREDAKRFVALSEEITKQTTARVARLTALSGRMLDEPLENLYFRGQERL